jgi:hypothetical protein
MVFTPILIFLTACPEMNYKDVVKFYNNSSKDVYIYGEFEPREFYSDTILMPLHRTMLLKIKENRGYSYNKIPNVDTVYFFILDADTISYEKCKVLQRYNVSISLDELKNLNYTLSYPPTENMKDIKMYPPYQ